MNRVLVILMMMVSLMGAEAFGQSKPSGRPCNQGDVAGAWALLSLRPLIEAPPGDPDFFPYQVWVFTAEGKYIKMSKAAPISKNEYDPFIDKAQSESGMLTTTYEVNEKKAYVKLQPAGGAQPFYLSCFTMTSDYIDAGKQIDMRRGDILLDLKSKDGRTLIAHLFRKIRQAKTVR